MVGIQTERNPGPDCHSAALSSYLVGCILGVKVLKACRQHSQSEISSQFSQRKSINNVSRGCAIINYNPSLTDRVVKNVLFCVTCHIYIGLFAVSFYMWLNAYSTMGCITMCSTKILFYSCWNNICLPAVSLFVFAVSALCFVSINFHDCSSEWFLQPVIDSQKSQDFSQRAL